MDDIWDNIMKTIATLRLKDICSQNNLNFKNLCDFLIKYKGVIIGSASLHCFDIECMYNDIDIFIENSNLKDVDCELMFYKCFDKSFSPFVYQGFFTKHIKYEKVDLSILDENVIQNVKNNVDIECASIMFDGNDWYLPFTGSLVKYFSNKETKLLKYKLEDYYAYEDKLINTSDSLPDNIETFYVAISNKVNKMSLPLLTIDGQCKQFYDKYRLCYTELFFSSRYLGTDIIIQCNQNDDIFSEIKIKFIIKNLCSVYNILFKISLFKGIKINHFYGDYFDDKTKKSYLVQLFCTYKQIYRILKYMARGYKFTNLDTFFNDYKPIEINYDNFKKID